MSLNKSIDAKNKCYKQMQSIAEVCSMSRGQAIKVVYVTFEFEDGV